MMGGHSQRLDKARGTVSAAHWAARTRGRGKSYFCNSCLILKYTADFNLTVWASTGQGTGILPCPPHLPPTVLGIGPSNPTRTGWVEICLALVNLLSKVFFSRNLTIGHFVCVRTVQVVLLIISDRKLQTLV